MQINTRIDATPQSSTLLGLVQSIMQQTQVEDEVVALAAARVKCGAVVLTGNFAGTRDLLSGQ
jgi:hypothetical protein